MRLINTSTFQLSEFYDSEIPKYAILSHTWGNEEVSYQEWCTRAFRNKAAGYAKIYNFCLICQGDGYEWAWTDTCCIDKTSSAELSEAINSMYRWYDRKVCYAYLVDVPSSDDIEAEDSAFALSRWFTRGWTLQELIAPVAVHFYSKDWIKIGERGEHSVVVARITGIPQRLLMGFEFLHKYSVAQKMSWASKRKTTRIEDIAYCLLGLFDVNMPLPVWRR
jgi:Heterokaryon incompatibility protein (HET)